jgi:radical SAM protein with 4Fe4S-binding SPASM domain
MTDSRQHGDIASAVRRMTVEVTTQCNYGCQHCSNRPIRPSQYSTVDTERLIGIVLEACDLGCRDFLLTGGEPLVWSDFERFYMQLQQVACITVRINSNGSLISKRIARLLAKYPPAKMHISIYGWDAKSYEGIVNRTGVYALFEKGVSYLHEYGIPFLFLVPGIRQLVENREKVENLAYRLGGKREIVWGYMLSSHVDPAARELNRRIRALRLDPAEVAVAVLREPGGIEKELRSLRYPRERDFRYLFSCLKKYPQYVIDSEMNLLPCITLRHPAYVLNLRNSSLESGLKFIEQLSCLPYRESQVFDRCTHCEIRGICKQCPANSFIETGNAEGIAEYYCMVAHEEARYLGVL